MNVKYAPIIDILPSADVRDSEGFERLALLLRQLTGIILIRNPKNLALVSNRMQRLAMQFGNLSLNEIAYRIECGDRAFTSAFVSAMTTNTTEFFRESAHFKQLTKLLPQILHNNIKAGKAELRVWCAAASTGQEPYSILITIKEALSEHIFDLKLLATDIDAQVLKKAIGGFYPIADIKGIPLIYQNKYFLRSTQLGKPMIAVKKEFKSIPHFALLNLLQEDYPFQHKFDVIFCRNVFIYFDEQTIHNILHKMSRALKIGGYLFVGHSEALLKIGYGFERVAPAVYRKKNH